MASKIFPRRRRLDQPPEAVAAVVTAETDAAVRLADSAAQRDLQIQRETLDLEEKRQKLAEEATERAEARKRTKQEVKDATKRKRKRRRKLRRVAARRLARARFAAALGGRLVAILVAMAAVTAWYGQFLHLGGPPVAEVDAAGNVLVAAGLGMPFLIAVTGATALEIIGLAMFDVARRAGEYRERAIRARLLGWSVIIFSAWSNYTHIGIVPAALSVAGPVTWEIYEWSRRREALHRAGLLRARPVRPRFPLDQVVLFPVWTFAAYRVAVRDRIESADRALELARIERASRSDRRRIERADRAERRRIDRSFGWWARRRTRSAVREAIRSTQAALAERARTELETARSMIAEVEGVAAAAALLLGPDRVRKYAHPIRPDQAGSTDPESIGTTIDARSTDAGSVDRIGSVEADPIESSRSVPDPIDPIGEAGHPIHPDVDPTRSTAVRSGRPDPIESTRSVRDSIDARSIDSDPIDTDSTRSTRPDPIDTGSADPIDPIQPDPIESTRSAGGEIDAAGSPDPIDGAADPIPAPPRWTWPKLRVAAANLVQAREWTADDVTAERLRTALRCSPKRAARLRDEILTDLQSETPTDTQPGDPGAQAAA